MLSFSAAALATAQAPDVLIYDGKTSNLFSNPLESRYDKENRPSFWIAPDTVSSGNWRGYVATWEISGKTLYLVKIDAWLCQKSLGGKSDCRPATLKELFGEAVVDDRVSASWFSGSLRVPDGERLQYVHAGYASVYERDIMFEVEAGKIIKQEVVDNTKREPPSSLELQRQEIEKLRNSSESEKPLTEKKKVDNKAPVVAGEGWGAVRLNAPRADVERVLGDGKNRSKYDDVYFVDFEAAGVQVSFSNEDNRVTAIFFYNRPRRDENFEVFDGKTDKEISWASSAEEVIKAYGKPKNDFSGAGWRRLVFNGIDFRFENNKMVRIGIPGN